MIVDDEKIVRAEIRRLADWEKYGMEIVGEAENGRAALHFLQENPVDLMITDLSMPGLSGIDFFANRSGTISGTSDRRHDDASKF
ncbi:MAG: response regulator [Candidatus Merdivicinus sp.]